MQTVYQEMYFFHLLLIMGSIFTEKENKIDTERKRAMSQTRSYTKINLNQNIISLRQQMMKLFPSWILD